MMMQHKTGLYEERSKQLNRESKPNYNGYKMRAK